MVSALVQHLAILLFSLPFALVLGLFVGLAVADHPRVVKLTLGFANILMTVPSLALFGIMVAVLAPIRMGIGTAPAVVAITIYSLLPILRNTVLALHQVQPKTIEAAKGIGLTPFQVLFRIRIPLSIPVMMAGVRNAVVLGVGIAAYASLVGAGGLGTFIFSGISRANFWLVGTGALLVSVLGIGLNAVFLWLEAHLTPRGLRVPRAQETRQ